jgi:hypothetical protein
MTDENGNGGRDAAGRFGKGNKISRGRPKTSLKAALARCGDIRDLARTVWEIAQDPKHPVNARLAAAAMIWNRWEGKPVARGTVAHAHQHVMFPSDWDRRSELERRQWIDGLRSRAVQGQLEPGDFHDIEDEDDE